MIASRRVAVLLASTMLCGAFSPKLALAQTSVSTHSDSLSGDDNEPNAERISVRGTGPISANGVTGRAIGGGLIQRQDAPKSVSTVSTDFIQKQAPTTNAFQLLRLTPGANAGESDPFNMQYSGSSFSIRGLQSTQIGFTYEAAPLNSSYNYSVDPAEWADNENLRTVREVQGSPDLASPTLNASGGVVNLYTRDPLQHFGGFADISGGSYSFARGFIRLDTGEIGNSGITAFASYSQAEADHVRGAGHDSRNHFDLGVLKTFANGSRTKLSLSFTNLDIENYKYPTLAAYQLYGRSNNYSSVFTGSNTNYYKLNQNPENSLLVSLPSNIVVNPNLNIDFTPYTYYYYGTTDFSTNVTGNSVYSGTEKITSDFNSTGSNTASTLVLDPYIEQTSRSGFETRVNYQIGINKFVVGQWFQYENDNLYSVYGRVTNGVPNNPWGNTDLYLQPNGQPIYAAADHSYVTTNAVFLGDTLNLLQDRLRIDLGVRAAVIDREGSDLLPGVRYKTAIHAAEPLPLAAIRYNFGDYSQVFASASTAFRLPAASAVFETAYGGKVSNVPNDALKSEYSISEEVGYRYQSPHLIADATFFNYNFTNRLISTAVYQNGQQYASTINGGGQSAQGVDVEIGTGPYHHIRPYVSGEYLHSTIDNNVQSGADYLPTTGKTAVLSPKFQFALGLDYDDGTYFGNASVKWVDSQYTTLMNDQSMPAYVTADFTVGYRLHTIGPFKRPEIRLNVINAANNNYLSGAYSVTSNARTTRGVFGTSIAGSNPTYYIATPFTAIVTLSTGF
ncbi:TonB-dependent receptor [Acetobacteraceae bacterium KSS8]|uniref:TonB-dependent receptor n=1 Tax=Endosaccharibacter trunci TaxID=2812733 RepID=A0ABT1WE96_9PROT|nr:TonB-dependent receptor [Acetobacteraceae bacterium KSS8]